MSTRIATIDPDSPVKDAASLMIERGVGGLPVVDGEGHVLGVVSEGDLIRRAESAADSRRSWWLRMLTSNTEASKTFVKTHGLTVADVMSSPAVAAGVDDDLATLSHKLEKRSIKRLPIVSGKRLVGIVSRADILRAMAASAAFAPPPGEHSDREIREDFLASIAKESWAQSAVVNPVVSDGVVHLWGVVEDGDQRKALLTAARAVGGVKGVEDHLGKEIPI